MGRIGLRAVLRWCLCFCAALATASIPVASAQTHAPKIVPPPQNSALNSAKEDPAPEVSSPEETPSSPAEPSAAPAAKPAPEPPVGPPVAPPAAPAVSPPVGPPVAPSAVPIVAPPIGPDVAFTPADGLALAGERGITHPVCLQCPPALYSYPAMMKRVQGNVTIDAIISKDGWVSDVKILGSLRSDLDEQAMKAVRTWQWKPAQDANGNPVIAHQTVVITFRLPK